MDIKRSNLFSHVLSLWCYLLLISPSHPATDRILQGQQLRDGENLLSEGGIFRLQFFSAVEGSKNRYLGIRYNNLGSKVWVANRNTPIPDTSGIFMIDESGNLIISYGGGSHHIIGKLATAATNVSATLLDSGNFILRELNSDGSEKPRVLWQSFDYPTDTLLPGMKLGINFKTKHTWSLTCWVNDQLPASGSFTLGIDPNDTRQLVIWWQGNLYWTSGLWRDGNFEYGESYGDNTYNYTSNENETYFTFQSKESYTANSNLPYMSSADGYVEGLTAYRYGGCNSYGSDASNPTLGCVMKSPDCRKKKIFYFATYNGFMSNSGFKFDGSYNWSISDCKTKCWNNCSCVAYATTNDNQTGCEIWSRGARFNPSVALDAREINVATKYNQVKWYLDRGKWWMWLVIAIAGVVVMLILCFIRRLRVRGKTKTEQEIILYDIGASATHSSESGKTKKPRSDGKKSHDLQFFSFESMASATENFATANKLGEGGYGPVYKGTLQNGLEIAIKRLSRNSGQGLVEFKNELKLIAKLQHTNLVRLVGCCIEREEKILVYEYMPNKSLDFFLFDSTLKQLLDWKKRLDIIEGVAQGLIYLHKYSRLRIIHRDLKASNILLDGEMNPKISDFGLARIFGRNESQANTNRVVGTYGYMSPEYAMEGIFSVKSDVFSFGILLLEIVSGRKNTSFYHAEHPLNLIGHAWELWRLGRALELIDTTLEDRNQNNQVLRCIHVGLLCVQDSPADRPTMLDAVSMINNDTLALSAPKQPLFLIGRSLVEADITKHDCSLNMMSNSHIEAR